MTTAFDLRDLPLLFERAILPAVRLHKAWELPMVVWEEGAVVWKGAAEIESQLLAAQSRIAANLEKSLESPLSE